jgi:hypothetical protein
MRSGFGSLKPWKSRSALSYEACRTRSHRDPWRARRVRAYLDPLPHREGQKRAKTRGVRFGRPIIEDEKPIRAAVLLAAIQGTARAGIAQGLRTLPNLTLLHAGHLVANRHRIIVIAVSLTDPLQRPNCRWFCLLLQG